MITKLLIVQNKFIKQGRDRCPRLSKFKSMLNIILVFILSVMLLLLSGCGTPQYDNEGNSSVYTESTVSDTNLQKESISESVEFPITEKAESKTEISQNTTTDKSNSQNISSEDIAFNSSESMLSSESVQIDNIGEWDEN